MTDISKVGFEADTSGLNQAEAAVDKLTAKVQALNEQLEKTNQAGAQASSGLEKVKTSQQGIASAPAIKIIPDDLSSKISDAAARTTQLAATIESAAARGAAIKNVSTGLGEVATKAESTNSSAAKLAGTLAAIGPISVGGRIGADLQAIGTSAEASGSSVKKFADSFSGVASAAISGSNLRTASSDISEIGRQSEATNSSVSKLSDGFRGLGSFASGGSFKGVSGELKSLEGEATSSAAGLGKITNSVEGLAEKFVVIGAATGQLVSGFEGVGEGASSVSEQLSKVGEATEGVRSIWEGVKAFFEDFKSGFSGAISDAKASADGMANSVDRIATSIQRRNLGVPISDIKSRMAEAKVEANAFAAASAGLAAKTAEAGMSAAGAGGAIEGVASAVSHGASVAHEAKAAHEGLGVSMHELHGIASALEVPLSQMGVHLGEVTRLSGAARLGIAGIGSAIVGGLAVYMAKLDEDTERAKQRLEGLSGVKMGDEYFNQVDKLDKELGTTASSVQPALESLIKLKNATQDLHGVQILTPGSADQLDKSRLSAEAMGESIAAVAMQFKLGGANAEEASKGVNDFFAAAVKSSGVTGNMLRQLENGSQGGQRFASALTNAFKGGSMNADQFAAELDKVPLSLSSLLAMLPLLASGSRSAFEEMEGHPKTLSGAVDKLSASFRGLFETMTGSEAKGGVVVVTLNSIADAIDRVNAGIKTYQAGKTPAADESFLETFGRKAAEQVDLTKKDWAQAKEDFGKINEDISKGMAQAGPTSHDADGWENFGRILGQVKKDASDFATGMDQAGQSANTNASFFESLGRGIGSIGTDLERMSSGWSQSNEGLKDGAPLYENIGRAAGMAATAISDAYTAADQGASRAFGSATSSVSSFVSTVVSGSVSALEAIGNFVVNSISKLTDWANQAVSLAARVGSALAHSASDSGSGNQPFVSATSNYTSPGDSSPSIVPDSGGDPGFTGDTGFAGFASGGQFPVTGQGGTDSQLVRFWATPGEVVTVTPPGGEPPAHPSYSAPLSKAGLPAFENGGSFVVSSDDKKTLGDALLPEAGKPSAEADLETAGFSRIIKAQTVELKDKLEVVKTAISKSISDAGSLIVTTLKAATIAAAATTAVTANTPATAPISSAASTASTATSAGGGGGGGVVGGGSGGTGSSDPRYWSKQEEEDAKKAEQQAKLEDAQAQQAYDRALAASRAAFSQQQQASKPPAPSLGPQSVGPDGKLGPFNPGASGPLDSFGMPQGSSQVRQFTGGKESFSSVPMEPYQPLPGAAPLGQGGVGSDAAASKIADAVQQNTDATKSIGEKQNSTLESVSSNSDKQASELGTISSSNQQDQSNNQQQTQDLSQVSQGVSTLSETTTSTGEATTTALSETTDATKAIGDDVKTSGDETKTSLDQVSTATQADTTATDSVRSTVADGTSTLSQVIESLGQTISSAIGDAATSIGSAVASAVSSSTSSSSDSNSSSSSSSSSSDASSSSSGSDSGSTASDTGSSDFSFDPSTMAMATGGQFVVPGSGGTDSQHVKFSSGPGDVVTVTPPGGIPPKNPAAGADVMGQSGTAPVEFWATPGEHVTVTPRGQRPPPLPAGGQDFLRKDGQRSFATGGQMTLGDEFGLPSVSKSSSDLISAHITETLGSQTTALKAKMDQLGRSVASAVSGSTTSIMAAVNSMASAIPNSTATATTTAAATATSSPPPPSYSIDQFGRHSPGFATGGQFAAAVPRFATGGQIAADEPTLARVSTDALASTVANKAASGTAVVKDSVNSISDKIVSALNSHTNTIVSGVNGIKDKFDAYRADQAAKAVSSPSPSAAAPTNQPAPGQDWYSQYIAHQYFDNSPGSWVTAAAKGGYPKGYVPPGASGDWATLNGGLGFARGGQFAVSPYNGMSQGGVFTVPGGEGGGDSVDVQVKAAPGEQIMVLTPAMAAKLRRTGKSAIKVQPSPLQGFLGDMVSDAAPTAPPMVPGSPVAMSGRQFATSSVTHTPPIADDRPNPSGATERTVIIQVRAGVQADDFIRSRAQIQRTMR